MKSLYVAEKNGDAFTKTCVKGGFL